MKALSVRGDYIMDMIAGKKKIEYRTWKTNYRGPLLMCSTAKKAAGAAGQLCNLCREFNGHPIFFMGRSLLLAY